MNTQDSRPAVLRTDFLAAMEKGIAEETVNGPFMLVSRADGSVRWGPVDVVGRDLDRALYGNDAENAGYWLGRARTLIGDGLDARAALLRLGWEDRELQAA